MVLVTVPQVNPNDEITNDSVNQGANALAAAVNGHLDDSNIEQLSGSKISAATTPASVMNDSGNVEKRFDEAFADYVIDGCVWSALSGLNGAMTTGHISVQGKRLTVPAIATHAFTPSKDTYVYLDASGLPVYTGEVANGAAAPVQPANTVQTYKIIASSTAITSVSDVHSKPVGVQNMSSRTIAFSTSSSTWLNPSTVAATVDPLTLTNVTIPGNGLVNVRLRFNAAQISSTVDDNRADYSIWDGTTQIAGAFGRTWLAASGGNGPVHFETTPIPVASGVHTFTLKIGTGMGAGHMSLFASSVTPMGLSLEIV